MGIILTSIRYMITPIIDRVNNLRTIIGDANILHDNCTSNGCWNLFLSVNIMPEELHTEVIVDIQ